ncbi:dihydrodipicolinate synthase family protein [Streptomyces sp. CA-111067]|uniref:dihydrodipicolinate synthase family protein n=1 Tax=Streptomyces sp. CA-111067 TaxID=3240046 RepID=UPI003D989916
MTHLLATVTVPLVTAFDREGRPDPEGVARLLGHVAEGGISSLMLLGSNGEGVAVETAEVGPYVAAVRERWARLAGPSGKVLVAVSGPATRQTLARARAALDAGADALVVNAPYYFRHTDEELLDHYGRVDALGGRWIAYNIPRYTGNPLGPQLVGHLAALEHCAGVKDSGGDPAVLAGFVAHAADRPGFAVSQGAESAMVDGLLAGAVGITPGLANLAPGPCVSLLTAVQDGDEPAARDRQSALDRLAALHTIRPGVAATKAALALLGLLDGPAAVPAAPFRPYTPDENARLSALLHASAELLPGGR